MPNRRQDERLEVVISVQIRPRDWTDVLTLSTGNIGCGGLFVRSSQPVPVGTQVAVTLQMPDGSKLALAGEVVHAIDSQRAATQSLAPGFGVRFAEKHALDMETLNELATARARLEPSRREVYITVPAFLVGSSVGKAEITRAYQLIDPAEGPPVVEPEEALAPPPPRRPPPLPGATPQASAAPPPPPPLPAARPLPRPAAATAPRAIPRPAVARPAATLPAATTPTPQPQPAATTSPQPTAAAAQPTPSQGLPAVPAVRPTRDAIYGIDFGTTYTSIALVVGSQLTVLKDERGNTMFPSIVCYPEKDRALVGWEAREQLALYSQSAFTSPKRLIGRRFDDPNIAPFLAASAVDLQAGPSGQIVARLFGDTVAIPQVCSEIFRHAAAFAERATSVPVERVLLSVPVGYQVERRSIKRAAEMAGLKVVGMVDEPVAAAVGCGLGHEPELVGVYDFGGGTFDFTLLEIQGGQFRVLAKAGDAWLGGDDFDLALANHAAEAFWKKHDVDLRQRKVEWQQLIFLCEAAKRRLSTVPEVELLAKGIIHTPAGPVDLRMTLDQTLLAEMCRALVQRSIDTVSSCLLSAGLQPDVVRRVAMTGGVSRMPMVHAILEEQFDWEIRLAVDPQHAVVVGNAIYASLLAKAGRVKGG